MSRHSPEAEISAEMPPSGVVASDNPAFGPVRRLYIWVLAIASLCVASYPIFLFEYYDYLHAWVSAHFAVMARAFLEHGILTLGGVPIQNAGTLTEEPDAYLHWPPLFPIVLSQVFALFGATTKVLHTFALLIQLGIATLLFFAARRLFSPLAGVMSALAFVNLPIIARYGHIGSQLHLAMLFSVLSFYCLYRHVSDVDQRGDEKARRQFPVFAILGTLSFAAAVWSSWEPLLALPGLALAALVTHGTRLWRASVSYGAAGGLALASLIWLYGSQYPFFFHTIKYRLYAYAGFRGFEPDGAMRVHDIVLGRGLLEISLLDAVLRFVSRLNMLGWAGIAAVIAAFAIITIRRRERTYQQALVIMLPLLSMWLAAAIVMPNHYYIHEYQLVLAAPFTALALGLSVHALSQNPRPFSKPAGRRVAALIIWIGIPAALLINRVPVDAIQYLRYLPMERESIQMAEIIERETADNAIIMMAGGDMVPIYYSNRHTVKGINNDRTFFEYIDSIMEICADCDYYSAVLHSQIGGYTSVIARYPIVWSGEWGMLVKVHSADQADAGSAMGSAEPR